jgi:hypothetical protein
MSDSEGKIISLRIFISELLRNEFKAACARQGKNMSEVVADFAKDYVAKYGAISSPDRTDNPPTESKAPPATKAKRGNKKETTKP